MLGSQVVRAMIFVSETLSQDFVLNLSLNLSRCFVLSRSLVCVKGSWFGGRVVQSWT